MSLNILCAICNEFYQPNDAVYSTTVCGHLFHQQCLFRWLNRSNTCPQCRRSCHRNRVHRVFLNFCEFVKDDEDCTIDETDTPIWEYLDLGVGLPRPQTPPIVGIKGGEDHDGNELYVARAPFDEDLVPACYIPQKGGAYVPWGCQAHLVTTDVEILKDTNSHKWIEDCNGHVPTGAIVTGYTSTGENLYTARAQYQGKTLLGKVHPTHHCCYMPHNGQEVNSYRYEVLVHVPKPEVVEH